MQEHDQPAVVTYKIKVLQTDSHEEVTVHWKTAVTLIMHYPLHAWNMSCDVKLQ